LSVSSRPGEGTEFTIILPLVPETDYFRFLQEEHLPQGTYAAPTS
jgi:hypothetical protein